MPTDSLPLLPCAQSLLRFEWRAEMVLDDFDVRQQAERDPRAPWAGASTVVLDKVQKALTLLPVIDLSFQTADVFFNIALHSRRGVPFGVPRHPYPRVRFVATIARDELCAWDESKGQVIESVRKSE